MGINSKLTFPFLFPLLRMELAEIKKLAEERRREKAEDRMARQRVKEQIAKDRAEREARNSKPMVVAVNPPQELASTTNSKKEYTTCRLQVGWCPQ